MDELVVVVPATVTAPNYRQRYPRICLPIRRHNYRP